MDHFCFLNFDLFSWCQVPVHWLRCALLFSTGSFFNSCSLSWRRFLFLRIVFFPVGSAARFFCFGFCFSGLHFESLLLRLASWLQFMVKGERLASDGSSGRVGVDLTMCHCAVVWVGSKESWFWTPLWFLLGLLRLPGSLPNSCVEVNSWR